MEHKKGIWILSTILILMIVFFIYDLIMAIDYEQRKQSGNDRWKQVEERIIRIENKVEELENGTNC